MYTGSSRNEPNVRFRKETVIRIPTVIQKFPFLFLRRRSVLVLFVTPSEERTRRNVRDSCNRVEREHRWGYATSLRRESENVNAQEGLGRSEPANPAPFHVDGRGDGETLSQSNACVRRTHGVICQSVSVLQPRMTRGSQKWAGAWKD